MSDVNKFVYHKKYGKGKIVYEDKFNVEVIFEQKNGSKTFLKKDCFQKYLFFEPLDSYSNNEMLVRNTKKNTVYDIDLFIDLYNTELNNEIKHLIDNGGIKQRVFNGKLVGMQNKSYIYVFECSEEYFYPDDTPIKLFNNEDEEYAFIVACEDCSIIISTGKFRGDTIDFLEFSAEPWIIIQKLIKHLEDLRHSSNKITGVLVNEGKLNINYNNKNITIGSTNAVTMALVKPITFIWGPPGTGKTETLAKIVLRHIKSGNRVLMVSCSNISVDEAIMRVFKANNYSGEGKIIRYGYPRKKELSEHDFLTSYKMSLKRNPEEYEKYKILIKENKKLSKNSLEFVRNREKIKKIYSSLKKDEIKCINDALFVVTTISKAIVDDSIFMQNFDVVIFDEVSMAYIPQIVYASSLAKSNFICLGDFCQLPPIVQYSDRSILNQDIFDFCGISEAVKKGISHNWLCMLNIQYRMHPKIADFSNRFMYNGLLKSANEMEDLRREITNISPIKGNSLGLIDLSGMMSVCNKINNGSRVNILSALLSCIYAIDSLEQYNVGIITPYSAQSKLLKAIARDIDMLRNDEKTKITCATVHQFQGSEQDVIIYDAVDCYKMSYPGMLLTSMNNDYANRLFNVALTRAKGKFLVVANVDYMIDKHVSPKLMFGKLLQENRFGRTWIGGNVICKENRSIIHNMMDLYVTETANEVFFTDIAYAEKEIRIDIPDSMTESVYINEFLEEINLAKIRNVNVIIRAENKSNLPENVKIYTEENKYVSNPITIIDKKIVWFGMPESSAKFISSGNHIETKYRPVIRLVGKNTVTALFGILEMDRGSKIKKEIPIDLNKDNLVTFVYKNITCDVCGNHMVLKKNRFGKFFLICSNKSSCSNAAHITIDLVEEYIYRNSANKYGQLCPKCNHSLEAKKGKFGTYIRCCGIDKHTFRLDEI